MKQTPLQFTKRQMQAVIQSPLTWVALGGVAIVLGLAGPFGTFEALPLPARLAYWALVATTTYLAGCLTVSLLEAVFHGDEGRPSSGVFALYGAAAGFPVSTIVWLINLWVFDASVIGYLPLLGYTVPVAAVASGLVAHFSRSLAGTERAPAASALALERPRLLDRLQADRRGEIYYLSMQDHYVEVVTSAGSSLVLMRMADAIVETAPVEGLQVHRSHWVATGAIRQVSRNGDRVVLQMADGAQLPVSRARAEDLKQAGIA